MPDEPWKLTMDWLDAEGARFGDLYHSAFLGAIKVFGQGGLEVEGSRDLLLVKLGIVKALDFYSHQISSDARTFAKRLADD
jgi:hypothetical protein